MRSYRRTVATRWDPADVWAYLSDFRTINQWDPRATGTCMVSGDGGVGSVYETDVSFLGRTSHMTYTVTCLEDPRRIEWVGHNGVVDAHDTIEVTPTAQGSDIDYLSSYAYSSFPWLLDRLLSRPLGRLCDDAQRGLHSTLAAASRP